MLETDPYGNFLLSGYDYGTARNWARLGMLYLQDGMWQGQRLLPEGWTQFVSTPAPAWKRPEYGGLFWVNGDGALAAAARRLLLPTAPAASARSSSRRTTSSSSGWGTIKATARA